MREDETEAYRIEEEGVLAESAGVHGGGREAAAVEPFGLIRRRLIVLQELGTSEERRHVAAVDGNGGA